MKKTLLIALIALFTSAAPSSTLSLAFALDCDAPPPLDAPPHRTFIGYRVLNGLLVPAYQEQSAFSYWSKQCMGARDIPRITRHGNQNQDQEEQEEEEYYEED
jgi:hypothetical protein